MLLAVFHSTDPKNEIKKFLSLNPRASIELFWGSKSSSCTPPYI